MIIALTFNVFVSRFSYGVWSRLSVSRSRSPAAFSSRAALLSFKARVWVSSGSGRLSLQTDAGPNQWRSALPPVTGAQGDVIDSQSDESSLEPGSRRVTEEWTRRISCCKMINNNLLGVYDFAWRCADRWACDNEISRERYSRYFDVIRRSVCAEGKKALKLKQNDNTFTCFTIQARWNDL